MEVPATPRISGRNLVRIFPIVIAHALGERGNRLNQGRRSGAAKDTERFHGSIDGNARVNGKKIFQSGGVVRMAVRYNNKIQLGEVHAKSFDVMLECRRIVSSVEEDALAVMLEESRKAPVFGDRFVIGKRVIENRNAILGGDSIAGNCKQDKSCGEREESANDFHRKSSWEKAGKEPQSSSPMRMAAPRTVVHRPRLSPTADCVTFMVRTILLEMR